MIGANNIKYRPNPSFIYSELGILLWNVYVTCSVCQRIESRESAYSLDGKVLCLRCFGAAQLSSESAK